MKKTDYLTASQFCKKYNFNRSTFYRLINEKAIIPVLPKLYDEVKTIKIINGYVESKMMNPIKYRPTIIS